MNYKSKYIYKITNIKNNKIYIGQSIKPMDRFKAHMKINKPKVENKKIHRDLLKYGMENFELEVLGNYENYNEMEKYYIKLYNSIEDGYNVAEGGNTPPVISGTISHFSKLSLHEVEKIKNILKNNDYSTSLTGEIAIKFNITESTVNRINNGELWFDENEIYPLRDDKYKINITIKKEILKGDLNLRQISEKLKVSHSRVKAINSGQNYKEGNYKYPLRKNLEYNKLRILM